MKKPGHTGFFLAYFLWSAALVMADKVVRVVITSGLSMISINVPCERAKAASKAGSKSSVQSMRTPT